MISAAKRRAQPGGLRTGRKGTAGFSLIEVLVSLAVAAMLMAALIRAFGSVWSQALVPPDVVGASILARSRMAEARTGTLESGATQSGMSGGYRWRVTIRSIPLPPPDRGDRVPSQDGTRPANAGRNDAQAILELYRVVVEVVSPAGHVERLEGLVAQGLAPAQFER